MLDALTQLLGIFENDRGFEPFRLESVKGIYFSSGIDTPDSQLLFYNNSGWKNFTFQCIHLIVIR